MESLPSDWSDAKKIAFLKKDINPNQFYFRYNDIGQDDKHGPWTSEEEELFFDISRRIKIPGSWGCFSKHIPGRTGLQCSKFYTKVLKEGKVDQFLKKVKSEKNLLYSEDEPTLQVPIFEEMLDLDSNHGYSSYKPLSIRCVEKNRKKCPTLKFSNHTIEASIIWYNNEVKCIEIQKPIYLQQVYFETLEDLHEMFSKKTEQDFMEQNWEYFDYQKRRWYFFSNEKWKILVEQLFPKNSIPLFIKEQLKKISIISKNLPKETIESQLKMKNESILDLCSNYSTKNNKSISVNFTIQKKQQNGKKRAVISTTPNNVFHQVTEFATKFSKKPTEPVVLKRKKKTGSFQTAFDCFVETWWNHQGFSKKDNPEQFWACLPQTSKKMGPHCKEFFEKQLNQVIEQDVIEYSSEGELKRIIKPYDPMYRSIIEVNLEDQFDLNLFLKQQKEKVIFPSTVSKKDWNSNLLRNFFKRTNRNTEEEPILYHILGKDEKTSPYYVLYHCSWTLDKTILTWQRDTDLKSNPQYALKIEEFLRSN